MQRGLNQTNIYYIHDLNKIETLKPLSRKDRKERSGPDRKGFSVQDRKELSDILILSNTNVVVVEGDQQEKNSSAEETAIGEIPKTDNTILEIQEVARINCNAELSKKYVSGLLKEYPPGRIKEKIELVGTSTGQIRNLPGLILDALREDYVNVPGKPAQAVNKAGGQNNNKTSRAGPGKKYDDLEWYPPDQRDEIREKKRELIKQLYMS